MWLNPPQKLSRSNYWGDRNTVKEVQPEINVKYVTSVCLLRARSIAVQEIPIEFENIPYHVAWIFLLSMLPLYVYPTETYEPSYFPGSVIL